jgi:3-oxoacid CoA-transferase subunit B
LKKRNNKLPKKRTKLAVLEVTPKGFKLLERAPGVSVEHIIASTEAELIIEGDIPEMVIE